MESTPHPTEPNAPRPRPSRRWYVLAAALLVASVAVFVLVLVGQRQFMHAQIDAMPRFVGPTGADGFVVTLDQPGKVNLFYENRGSLDGRSFDTPRRQVWTNFDTPSMRCTVTHVDSGEAVAVRLPGVGEVNDKTKVTRDLVIPYDLPERQGHSAWVFDVDRPGDYRIVLDYVDAVYDEPGSITIPSALTKAQKKQMLAADGEAYDADRRNKMEQASLAELEPVDVLFAVGPDPTAGGYFQVIGIKGAATVLAFGFTFSVLIALVTFMLRSGHVTPRGELAKVKRVLASEHEA